MSRLTRLRYKEKTQHKLNVIPFADTILVLVFFALMSTTFYCINDMGIDAGVVTTESKSNLFLKLTGTELILSSNSSVLHRFQRQKRTGEFSYDEVKTVLGKYKKTSHSITFEPENEMTFEEIAKIMDIVRSQFKKILFGNLS